MSQENSVSQNTHDHIYQQARCFKVWADIGEFILEIINGELFACICRRASLLITATIIPGIGLASDRACAAILNMTESGFEQFAKRRNLPFARPGAENLYALSDLAKTFEPPETAPETTHPRCAKKPDTNSTRSKPKKK